VTNQLRQQIISDLTTSIASSTLRNPKSCYSVHKNLPFGLNLSHLNPVHTFNVLLYRSTVTNFQLILLLPGCLFLSVLPIKTLYAFLTFHACNMLRPPHRTCFYRPCNMTMAHFCLQVHSIYLKYNLELSNSRRGLGKVI